jgi:hypothetical protein
MRNIHFLIMAVSMTLVCVTEAKLISNLTISSGADNIEHGGRLSDGRLALKDRGHVYKNVPSFLADIAEYVKLANADRETKPLTISFTLTEAADLYLFIDLRVGHGSFSNDPSTHPTNPELTRMMTWVIEEGFVDTGINIAIDEGDDGRINSYGRLYKKSYAAGSVTLREQNDGLNRNMYGFAAVHSEPDPKILGFMQKMEAGPIAALGFF